jgi:hypothetical protein
VFLVDEYFDNKDYIKIKKTGIQIIVTLVASFLLFLDDY